MKDTNNTNDDNYWFDPTCLDHLLPKCPIERTSMEIEAYDTIIKDAIAYEVSDVHLNRYKASRQERVEKLESLVHERVDKRLESISKNLDGCVDTLKDVED